MKISKKTALPIVILATILIIVLLVSDVILSSRRTEKTDFAMGAVISQTITGKDSEMAADEIMAAIRKRENAISRKTETSEIAILNKNKASSLSPETAEVLTTLLGICEKTDGAVDVTVGALTEVWNIGSENFVLPDRDLIEEARTSVSWQKVRIADGKAYIASDQQIDLGFAGKGIACDDAKKILEENRITEAIINVGGSLCLYGKKDFSVGIRNPLGSVSDYMAVLTVGEGFISTSGNYERFSEYEGKKYHHILSVQTGFPVENNLLSVTVFCKSGLLSDALSTACYCLGYEKSLSLLEEYGAEAVFIFDSNEVRVTDGLKDKIEITDNEFELWKEN